MQRDEITYLTHCLWLHAGCDAYLMGDRDLFILYNQNHSCWCPGDARRQDISNRIIGQALALEGLIWSFENIQP